jgi:hypothetical protein
VLSGSVSRAVGGIGRWLLDLYALEIGDFRAEHFLLSESAATALKPEGGPRTGVLVVESEVELELGLLVDERDSGDLGTLVEETSHLVCLAYHARRDLSVSQLALETQGEIDRFLFRRLCAGPPRIPDPFGAFRWASWLDAALRQRYRLAHVSAARYCRDLERRHPRHRDTPALLSELRAYYRASPEAQRRRRLG